MFQPYPKGSVLEREFLQRCSEIEARVAARPEPANADNSEQPSIYTMINAMNFQRVTEEFVPWIQRQCRGKQVPLLTREVAVP